MVISSRQNLYQKVSYAEENNLNQISDEIGNQSPTGHRDVFGFEAAERLQEITVADEKSRATAQIAKQFGKARISPEIMP